MPPQIIAFGHRSRMGKDTCATLLHSMLKTERGKLKVKTIGFASKLKAICHDLYKFAGVKNEQHYENHPEDRLIILPYFGTDVVQVWIDFGNKVREYAPNTWIDNTLTPDYDCDVLLVKDLRFHNEADAIKDRGGWVYKVHNPRVPYRDSPADAQLESYEGWDDVLMNDKDMQNLNSLLIPIVERYEAL